MNWSLMPWFSTGPLCLIFYWSLNHWFSTGPLCLYFRLVLMPWFSWRDKCDCTFLTKDECQTIINDLCTNYIYICFFLFLKCHILWRIKNFKQTNEQVPYALIFYWSLMPDFLLVPYALIFYWSLMPWYSTGPLCLDILLVPYALIFYWSLMPWYSTGQYALIFYWSLMLVQLWQTAGVSIQWTIFKEFGPNMQIFTVRRQVFTWRQQCDVCRLWRPIHTLSSLAVLELALCLDILLAPYALIFYWLLMPWFSTGPLCLDILLAPYALIFYWPLMPWISTSTLCLDFLLAPYLDFLLVPLFSTSPLIFY